MKRISLRCWSIWLLIAILLGGIGLFVAEYSLYGENWVMKEGSPHVYATGSTIPAKGTIVDRNGNFLLSYGENCQYAQDASLRMSVLHWLGDSRGNIYAPIISHYTKQLTGYDPVDGIYNYGNQGGQATLTISATVQQVAMEAMGSYKGTLAVYNYKTGQILCAVTTPTFDPENEPDIEADTTGAYTGVYMNRFTQASYVPGSIFKIVTTAAALEHIPDIMDRTFQCTGSYHFGTDQVTCQYIHGYVDIKSAMMVSCNCAYAQIALLLEEQGLQKYVDQFGVLQSASFDGMKTAEGNIALAGSADVELAWSAIGQHKDLINPYSFLRFVGAIANGGQGVQPYIVDSVRAGGKVTYQAQARLDAPIMDADTARIMQEFMRNNVVMNYGSQHFPGLTVCAKSGTGEVGGNAKPNALFTGFVADEQYPLAFIVVVENGGYGQTVCIPILTKVLAACKAELDA